MEIFYKDEEKSKTLRKFTVWLCATGALDNEKGHRVMAMSYKRDLNDAIIYTGAVNTFDEERTKVEISDLIFDHELRWKLKTCSKILIDKNPSYRPQMILRAKHLLKIIEGIEKEI